MYWHMRRLWFKAKKPTVAKMSEKDVEKALHKCGIRIIGEKRVD